MSNQIQFAWAANVKVDTGDIGIATTAGWVDRLDVSLEYVDFKQLTDCLPKLFSFVPYKNIGGMELNIPFYESRVHHFIAELVRVSNQLDEDGVIAHYSEEDFHGYSLLTVDNPFKLAEGFFIEIDYADDGLQTYGFDTQRHFNCEVVYMGQHTKLEKRHMGPELVTQIAEVLLKAFPTWQTTSWGYLYISVLLVKYFESLDYESAVGTYPSLVFKYGSDVIKVALSNA